MNTLNLKLVNASKLKPTILIDGKAVKAKQNKYGSYQIEYKTQSAKVNVKVFRFLELSGKLWLLMSLLFFIVSVFGLFDVPYSKNYIVLDCEFEIDLTQNTNVVFTFNNSTDKEKAIEIESEIKVTEIKNSFYEDKKVKTRNKIVNIARFVLFVIIAICIGLLISKKIGA